MRERPVSASAASASGRTFDGPQPKRPSRGSNSAGIVMGVCEVIWASHLVAGRNRPRFDVIRVPRRGPDVSRRGPDQPAGALLLDDVGAPPGGAGAGEH